MCAAGQPAHDPAAPFIAGKFRGNRRRILFTISPDRLIDKLHSMRADRVASALAGARILALVGSAATFTLAGVLSRTTVLLNRGL